MAEAIDSKIKIQAGIKSIRYISINVRSDCQFKYNYYNIYITGLFISMSTEYFSSRPQTSGYSVLAKGRLGLGSECTGSGHRGSGHMGSDHMRSGHTGSGHMGVHTVVLCNFHN